MLKARAVRIAIRKGFARIAKPAFHSSDGRWTNLGLSAASRLWGLAQNHGIGD
jgi:hypothetical protein